ncbi:testis anion transporter 1 isoform X2 [Tamandua tetradactyla]|uniref:testis anion transporter 1 isoform X2 n=1 Tax=Tamandua tetradactyla TaxID=48850 RepID=UPI004054711A
MQPERSSQSFNTKYRQNSFIYDIRRDVYNEENFQQEHRTKEALSSGNMDINISTVRHHVQCRCSWHKFLRCMLVVFPFLEWICLYRFKDWLLGDLLAGISVSLVQVPQGTFFLVSALMINVLKVSPFNSGDLVMGTFIKDDFSDHFFFVAYNKSLNVVASTTFLAGIIQLSMGMLGFGFMATYLPESVINAYLAAAALHIMLSQMTCVFGVMISFHSGPIAFFYNIVNYCLALPKANSTSILLFLTAVVALRVNKCIKISFNRYPIEFPMEFVLIVGFTVIANRISMATEASRMLVEMIPYRFLFPIMPKMDLLSKVILQAVSLSFVSSSLLIFLGKKIAMLHNYKVNSNQDLIAIGLCNVVSSFFRSYVFTGALARTTIQNKSGGRQQFASLVGAGVMLLLMVKAGHFFYELPNALLAGIILSNVLPYLEDIFTLPSLWKQDQYECVIWLVTFSSAIFLGLDAGLLVSIAFAFFLISVRSHRTKIILLGQIPNTNIYRSVNDFREVLTIPGVKIFQCCNSITFVNVYHIKHKLLKEVCLKKVPLKEEEVFRLFNRSSDTNTPDKICRCYCNCDEPEPPPRVLYTERFESKMDNDSSSINLVRCSRFESMSTSQNISDEQVPYTISSTSQRNLGQNQEEVEKVWLPHNPLRNNSLPPLPEAAESQGRSRSLLPYSDVSLLPSTHTIILDFSMVHFVDAQASVILRQMCNAFQNANILVLIAGCHSSVVRALERNDFFDAGITKAQLFLTLHDAVLFALSRKFPEPSELSMDESETVLQETYSQTEKNDESRYKMSFSHPESQKIANSGFNRLQGSAVEEESQLDLELEPTLESEQETELNVELDLDPELERESELEPETEPEPELELESELEPETEPKPRSRSRTHSQPFSSLYKTQVPGSHSQPRPQARSVERRHQPMDFLSPKDSDTKNPWERN